MICIVLCKKQEVACFRMAHEAVDFGKRQKWKDGS